MSKYIIYKDSDILRKIKKLCCFKLFLEEEKEEEIENYATIIKSLIKKASDEYITDLEVENLLDKIKSELTNKEINKLLDLLDIPYKPQTKKEKLILVKNKINRIRDIYIKKQMK